MGIHIDGPNSKITGDHFVSEQKVTGVAATFTGDVGIGGTLTYEDVTNVDSVGLITARSGVHIGPTAGVGATIYSDGGARFSGVVTATSFKGAATNLTNIPAANLTGTLPAIDGSNLTGIDATAIKFGGAVKVQANASGAVATGILTANSGADAVTFLKGNSVGIGTTTTAGRNAGVGTATGEIIYNASDSVMQVWSGTNWETVTFKPPINVSGGTVSGSARSGYVTHTFTSSGSLVTDGALTSAEVFVIGGGGGGGGNRYGGGGGAGGANYGTGITLTATTHPVLIGNGGSGGTAQGPSSPQGSKGSDGGSSAFQSTAPHPLYRVGRGGGGGGSHDVPQPHRNGQPGGCGGGATSYGGKTGGTTTQPPYNPGKPTNYGTAGANYQSNPNPNSVFGGGWAAAGGGGAGQAGFGPESPGANDQRFRGGGNGGDGVQLSISGTATYYGGGGGGSSFSYVTTAPNHQAPNQMKCRGGNGGGGSGNNQPGSAPTQTGPGLNPYYAGTNGSSPNQHGVVNTGSGGSGAQPTWSFSLIGGNGGSGVVIIAYPKTQAAGEVRF